MASRSVTRAAFLAILEMPSWTRSTPLRNRCSKPDAKSNRNCEFTSRTSDAVSPASCKQEWNPVLATSHDVRHDPGSNLFFLGRQLLYVNCHIEKCIFPIGKSHRVHRVIATRRFVPRLIGYYLGRELQ